MPQISASTSPAGSPAPENAGRSDSAARAVIRPKPIERPSTEELTDLESVIRNINSYSENFDNITDPFKRFKRKIELIIRLEAYLTFDYFPDGKTHFKVEPEKFVALDAAKKPLGKGAVLYARLLGEEQDTRIKAKAIYARLLGKEDQLTPREKDILKGVFIKPLDVRYMHHEYCSALIGYYIVRLDEAHDNVFQTKRLCDEAIKELPEAFLSDFYNIFLSKSVLAEALAKKGDLKAALEKTKALIDEIKGYRSKTRDEDKIKGCLYILSRCRYLLSTAALDDEKAKPKQIKDTLTEAALFLTDKDAATYLKENAALSVAGYLMRLSGGKELGKDLLEGLLGKRPVDPETLLAQASLASSATLGLGAFTGSLPISMATVAEAKLKELKEKEALISQAIGNLEETKKNAELSEEDKRYLDGIISFFSNNKGVLSSLLVASQPLILPYSKAKALVQLADQKSQEGTVKAGVEALELYQEALKILTDDVTFKEETRDSGTVTRTLGRPQACDKQLELKINIEMNKLARRWAVAGSELEGRLLKSGGSFPASLPVEKSNGGFYQSFTFKGSLDIEEEYKAAVKSGLIERQAYFAGELELHVLSARVADLRPELHRKTDRIVRDRLNTLIESYKKLASGGYPAYIKFQAKLDLANLYLMLDRKDDAEELCNELLETPDALKDAGAFALYTRLRATYYVGLANFMDSEYLRAAQLWKAADELDKNKPRELGPRSPEALIGRARALYLAKGLTGKFLEDFKNSVKGVWTGNWEAFYGEYEKAVKLLLDRQKINLDEKDIPPLMAEIADESSEARNKYSHDPEGRLLVLVCLEAEAKKAACLGDGLKAARLHEEALKLFLDNKGRIEQGDQFEAQIRYDLAAAYRSVDRLYDAYVQYEEVKKIGYGKWVEKELLVLSPSFLGLERKSDDFRHLTSSAYLRRLYSKGMVSFSASKEGGSSSARIYLDEKKTKWLDAGLASFTDNNFLAYLQGTVKSGKNTFTAGIKHFKEAAEARKTGLYFAESYAFSRFLTAGAEGGADFDKNGGLVGYRGRAFVQSVFQPTTNSLLRLTIEVIPEGEKAHGWQDRFKSSAPEDNWQISGSGSSRAYTVTDPNTGIVLKKVDFIITDNGVPGPPRAFNPTITELNSGVTQTVSLPDPDGSADISFELPEKTQKRYADGRVWYGNPFLNVSTDGKVYLVYRNSDGTVRNEEDLGPAQNDSPTGAQVAALIERLKASGSPVGAMPLYKETLDTGAIVSTKEDTGDVITTTSIIPVKGHDLVSGTTSTVYSYKVVTSKNVITDEKKQTIYVVRGGEEKVYEGGTAKERTGKTAQAVTAGATARFETSKQLKKYLGPVGRWLPASLGNNYLNLGWGGSISRRIGLGSDAGPSVQSGRVFADLEYFLSSSLSLAGNVSRTLSGHDFGNTGPVAWSAGANLALGERSRIFAGLDESGYSLTGSRRISKHLDSNFGYSHGGLTAGLLSPIGEKGSVSFSVWQNSGHFRPGLGFGWGTLSLTKAFDGGGLGIGLPYGLSIVNGSLKFSGVLAFFGTAIYGINAYSLKSDAEEIEKKLTNENRIDDPIERADLRYLLLQKEKELAEMSPRGCGEKPVADNFVARAAFGPLGNLPLVGDVANDKNRAVKAARKEIDSLIKSIDADLAALRDLAEGDSSDKNRSGIEKKQAILIENVVYLLNLLKDDDVADQSLVKKVVLEILPNFPEDLKVLINNRLEAELSRGATGKKVRLSVEFPKINASGYGLAQIKLDALLLAKLGLHGSDLLIAYESAKDLIKTAGKVDFDTAIDSIISNLEGNDYAKFVCLADLFVLLIEADKSKDAAAKIAERLSAKFKDLDEASFLWISKRAYDIETFLAGIKDDTIDIPKSSAGPSKVTISEFLFNLSAAKRMKAESAAFESYKQLLSADPEKVKQRVASLAAGINALRSVESFNRDAVYELLCELFLLASLSKEKGLSAICALYSINADILKESSYEVTEAAAFAGRALRIKDGALRLHYGNTYLRTSFLEVAADVLADKKLDFPKIDLPDGAAPANARSIIPTPMPAPAPTASSPEAPAPAPSAPPPPSVPAAPAPAPVPAPIPPAVPVTPPATAPAAAEFDPAAAEQSAIKRSAEYFKQYKDGPLTDETETHFKELALKVKINLEAGKESEAYEDLCYLMLRSGRNAAIAMLVSRELSGSSLSEATKQKLAAFMKSKLSVCFSSAKVKVLNDALGVTFKTLSVEEFIASFTSSSQSSTASASAPASGINGQSPAEGEFPASPPVRAAEPAVKASETNTMTRQEREKRAVARAEEFKKSGKGFEPIRNDEWNRLVDSYENNDAMYEELLFLILIAASDPNTAAKVSGFIHDQNSAFRSRLNGLASDTQVFFENYKAGFFRNKVVDKIKLQAPDAKGGMALKLELSVSDFLKMALDMDYKGLPFKVEE